MPYITATPVPAAGLIQIDVDWTDSRVDFARLERVNIATGEVQTVRPHTAILSSLGQFMRMSNGRGRWFDTDAPFDTPVTYRVYNSATPTSAWYGSTPGTITQDLFGRTVGAGATWGTPDQGLPYLAFGTTTEALVAAGEGTLSLPAENVLRGQVVANGLTRTNWQMRYRVGLDVIPTGDSVLVWTYMRLDGPVDNYVAVAAQFTPGSNVLWQASKEVAGSASVIASGSAGFAYSVSVGAEVRAELNGSTVRLKLWAQGATEPTAWTAELEVPDLPSTPGRAAVVAFIPTASTTALPMVFDFDNLAAAGSDDVNSPQVMLASEGHSWLRDPLRPCNSIRLEECIDVSMCADSNDGFEVGTDAGWSAYNGTVTAVAGSALDGSYRGLLTVDYDQGQIFGTDAPWTTTLYNWEVDAQGWVGEGGTTTAARVTSPVHDGVGALRAIKTGMGAGTESIRFNDAQGLRNLSANGPTISVWAQVPAGSPGTNWVAHIEAQDPAFAWQAGADVPLVPGQWRLISYTPPPGLLANFRSLGMSFTATGVSGSGTVYIDTMRQGVPPAAVLDRRVPVVASTTRVRAAGWLMSPTAQQARLAIAWVTAGGSYITASSNGYVTLVPGNWTRFEIVATAPAASATAYLMWQLTGSPAEGVQLYGDAFEFAATGPHAGAFFVSMDAERRDTNASSVAPANRQLPMTVSRPRRGVDSTLTLATARFEDRDALIAITEPGTPLIFSAPQEYGIPQKYWDVGTTDVSRGLPDHRFQPRIHTLPIGEREAPVGPGKAPCGASYADACADVNDTWSEAQAAGMTWLDLTDVA